jgi:outer membrane protein assembly factor BamB
MSFWRIAFALLAGLCACSRPGRVQEVGSSGSGGAVSPVAAKEAERGVGVTVKPTAAEETAESWPLFRGDGRHTGRTKRVGPREARLEWVFRTRGRIYADAAIGPDGTVYVASHDHHLYAVDKDGRERWSLDTGGKVWATPAIGRDGTIYVGTDADQLLAVAPDGRRRWSFSTTIPPKKGERHELGRWDVDTSPVLLSDGTIVFGCHYYLYAVHPSGKMRWQFQAGVDRVKIFSSPAVGPDGTIYFGTQGNRFFALNRSAKVLWNIETEGDNDGAPTVGDDGTVYFGSDDGIVRAVAPGGQLRWRTDLDAPIRAPLAVGWDGTIYVPTYGVSPFLAALDGKTGQVRWRFRTEPGEGDFFGIQSGPLVDGEGYIYFGARDKRVYCVSPKGRRVWSYETGGDVDAGPVLGGDGTLYVGSDDKRLYAFAS